MDRPGDTQNTKSTPVDSARLTSSLSRRSSRPSYGARHARRTSGSSFGVYTNVLRPREAMNPSSSSRCSCVHGLP